MSQEEKLPKILIVEDDERLARLTQEYLIRNGLEVGVEPDGNRAIRRIIAEQPDLVVLDVMLPGADGLTICREVRPHYHQPILMLTARTEDMDQVLGLEMGADDYVAKPVQPRVLLARIRALLRRTDKAPEDEVAQRIEFDDLVIDNGGRSVTLMVSWLISPAQNMTCSGYWLRMRVAFYRVKTFSSVCEGLNMMVKTVQLTCVFRVFVQKLAMIQKIQNELRLCVVKVIFSLKKPTECNSLLFY